MKSARCHLRCKPSFFRYCRTANSLGSAAAIGVKVDVRVLAATNINMVDSIANKTFREDLYYRLSSFVLSMPSLRQRKEEIPMMLRHFMIQVAERYACPLLPLSARLVKACENYPWPGNIRELENFVKRYLVLGDEEGAPLPNWRADLRQHSSRRTRRLRWNPSVPISSKW